MGGVFPHPVLAGAAIGRVFERAPVVIFTALSYRLNGKIIPKVRAEIGNLTNIEKERF
jgi:hypothetical protein